MTDGEKSKPFNIASAASPANVGSMTLIIDLQQCCVQYLARDEAKAYLDHMGEVLKGLREKGAVGWVTIGEVENDLILPDAGNTARRDKSEWDKLGFSGEGNNNDLLEDFLKEHGPKKDEVVFRKKGFSALSEEEPALKNYLDAQGIEKVTICGGMAGYCVGLTACDAVRSGREVSVMSDTLIGWPGGERSANFLQEGATWHGEDHANKIREIYGDIMDRVDFSPSEDILAKDSIANGVKPAAPLLKR